MSKNYKRFISLLMAITMAFVFCAPIGVNASEIRQTENKIKDKFLSASEDSVLSAYGDQLPALLVTTLSEKDVLITDDTLVEVFPADSDNGSTIMVTNVDGNLVTKTSLSALDENGEFKSLSVSELVRSTELGGAAGSSTPFNNSFNLVFSTSFYAYPYGGDDYGIIQPQTIMFIYYDDSDLYNKVNLSLTYTCTGDEGYFSNGVFVDAETNPLIRYNYRISLSKSDARARTYYSKTKAMSSTKGILMNDSIGGAHNVSYTLTVNVGESSERTVTRTVELFNQY